VKLRVRKVSDSLRVLDTSLLLTVVTKVGVSEAKIEKINRCVFRVMFCVKNLATVFTLNLEV
jgi:hypothetical protein